MKLFEIDSLGKKTPSLEDLIKKYSDQYSADFIKNQHSMGVSVEREHTGQDEKLASEIARDHLNEIPDYYSRLKKVEKNKRG